LRGRAPVVRSHSIEQLESDGEGLAGRMNAGSRASIARAGLRACIATTDVHEYGKILVETVLRELGVAIIDGGTSTDPNDLAELAQAARADFIALSSYNGVALQFVTDLKDEMKKRQHQLPLFVGGKLNRIPDGSNTSLPVDIRNELTAAGAIVCPNVELMLDRLPEIAGRKLQSAS
jgi:methylmalonyl-CoA mutase cobalamin-binding subunit